MITKLTYRLIGATFILGFLVSGITAEAYSTYGSKWPAGKVVNYYINTANISGLAPTDVIADVQAGANAWHNQAGVNLNLVYAGATSASTIANDGKNNVFFRYDSSQTYVGVAYYWWDGSGNLIDSDIMFNELYPYFTNTMACSSGAYVQNLAVHEFGHFIGMGHSTVGTATMYPNLAAWCGHDQEQLDPDDIAGVQSIYSTGTTAYSHIGLSASSLSFTSSSSSAPVSQSVTLTNSGQATMNWTSSANQSWCHMSPSSGSIPVGTSAQVNVSVDALVNGGTYSCSIAVSDSKADNSPQYISASYKVIGDPDTTAPTVSITSPANSARVSGSVTITASASDASGIAKVEFYVDNALKASDAASPYSYKWNINKQVSAGNHVITVKAYDKASPSNVSSASITVVK